MLQTENKLFDDKKTAEFRAFYDAMQRNNPMLAEFKRRLEIATTESLLLYESAKTSYELALHSFLINDIGKDFDCVYDIKVNEIKSLQKDLCDSFEIDRLIVLKAILSDCNRFYSESILNALIEKWLLEKNEQSESNSVIIS
jgi:hypothetical protein